MKQQSRIFSIKEQLRNIYYGAKGFVLLKRRKKLKLLNLPFKERIMLAVTEVNSCHMCSFVHTKIALGSGMSSDQIQAILSGDTSDVPEHEAVAVIFGQHFADSKESPSDDAIHRLVKEYGFQTAETIVAACNMITMTNGMGISMDHFFNRLKFHRIKKSNIFYELFNPLFTMLLFPLFVVLFFVIGLFTQLRFLQPKYRFES